MAPDRSSARPSAPLDSPRIPPGPALMPGRARDHPIETPVRSTDSMIGMATASQAAQARAPSQADPAQSPPVVFRFTEVALVEQIAFRLTEIAFVKQSAEPSLGQTPDLCGIGSCRRY